MAAVSMLRKVDNRYVVVVNELWFKTQ